MKALPANRVAALAAFLSGLAGCATAAAGAWPSATTQNIAAIGGFVLTMAGPISHVVGSWLWDRTPAGQAAAMPHVYGNAAVEEAVPYEIAATADDEQLEEAVGLVARGPYPDGLAEEPTAPGRAGGPEVNIRPGDDLT